MDLRTNRINRLEFIIEMVCVYCAVWIESLYKVDYFSLQRVLQCFETSKFVVYT